MPLDPSLSLQGKPVAIEGPDYPALYRTLAQIKYLGAEEEGSRARAALTGTQNQVALADLAASNRLRAVDPTGGGTLRSLSGGPGLAPGTTPEPPTPQAGASPTPAAAAPQRPDTATLALRYLQADPIKGLEAAKGLFDMERVGLENRAKDLETVSKKLATTAQLFAGVTDQTGYDLARDFAGKMGADVSKLPPAYDPKVVLAFGEQTRTAQQRIEQGLEVNKQKIDQQRADSERILAEHTRRKLKYPVGPTGIIPVPESQPDDQPMPSVPTANGSTPGAGPQPLPGTAPAMPPGAAEAAGYEQRALAAHTQAVRLEDQGVNVAGGWQKLASGVPLIGNYLTPTDLQKYNQAKSDFITAISRGESPRMTPQQLALYDKQYFPQPGDSAKTIEQKRTSREAALKELRIQTNRPEGLTPPGQTTMPGTTPAGKPGPKALPDDREIILQRMLKKRSDLTREQIIKTLGWE